MVLHQVASRRSWVLVMAGSEIKLPSGWYVENANSETPIYLVHWESGKDAQRFEIDTRTARLLADSLNDAALRCDFRMRSE